MTNMRRRTFTLLVAVLVLVGAWAVPVAAAPGDPTAPPDEGSANMTLGEALEKANREWLDAQAILDASKKKQADLAAQIASAGASIKQVVHDRAFTGSDISAVHVLATIETRNHEHLAEVRERLKSHGVETFDS